MEEKERYEWNSRFDEAIKDNQTGDIVNAVEVLNKQDKQIKELEEQTYPAYKREHKRRAYLENIEVPRLEKENQRLHTELSLKVDYIHELVEVKEQLKQELEDYKDICHKHYIDCPANLDRVLLGMEQQLHDLPKKIVREIRNNIQTPFQELVDEVGTTIDISKQRLFNVLDTILKKYGGENE